MKWNADTFVNVGKYEALCAPCHLVNILSQLFTLVPFENVVVRHVLMGTLADRSVKGHFSVDTGVARYATDPKSARHAPTNAKWSVCIQSALANVKEW